MLQRDQEEQIQAAAAIEVKRSFRLPRTNGWDPETFSGNPFPFVSWGAAVVETETDPISLSTSVRGVWLAADCGKILNRELAEAEIESEIYRSITSSTLKPLSNRYGLGDIPLTPARSCEKIPIHISFIESRESKSGGIGELPDSLIPSALIQAVSTAMDVKLNRPADIRRTAVHAAGACQAHRGSRQ